MKLYLSLKSIPELADLDRKSRGRKWRRHSFKAFLSWKTYLGFAVLLAFIRSGIWIKNTYIPAHQQYYLGAAVYCICWLIGFTITYQFIVAAVRPYLQQERLFLDKMGLIKQSEQAGPEYPPQGVGSPDP